MRLIQQSDTLSTAGSRAVLALEDLPEVLTVEESAAVLRISRTAAWPGAGG